MEPDIEVNDTSENSVEEPSELCGRASASHMESSEKNENRVKHEQEDHKDSEDGMHQAKSAATLAKPGKVQLSVPVPKSRQKRDPSKYKDKASVDTAPGRLPGGSGQPSAAQATGRGLGKNLPPASTSTIPATKFANAFSPSAQSLNGLAKNRDAGVAAKNRAFASTAASPPQAVSIGAFDVSLDTNTNAVIAPEVSEPSEKNSARLEENEDKTPAAVDSFLVEATLVGGADDNGMEDRTGNPEISDAPLVIAEKSHAFSVTARISKSKFQP
jgi:hypothetical protein